VICADVEWTVDYRVRIAPGRFLDYQLKRRFNYSRDAPGKGYWAPGDALERRTPGMNARTCPMV